MQSLSKAEQIKLIQAIPQDRLIAASQIYNTEGGMMKGCGIGDDILNFFKNTIGPIVSEIGPVILKEVLIPLIKGKVGLGKKKGKGLSLAGGSLKLAGQGKMNKNTGKGTEAMKIKMAKVRAAKKK